MKSENLKTVTQEIIHTLKYMADSGCSGFECSDQSLEIMQSWGKPRVRKPVKDSLEKIRTDIGDCKKCSLCKERNHIVFGSGNPKARLVFVGEAPGVEEDQQGEPFVGPAGQLLTKIIQAINLTREQVYIGNVVKCRPPNNRKPEPDEIRTCLPNLNRQISVIQPEFIVALGSVAAQALLNTDTPISALRGKFADYKGARLMPTFHPSYLLRNPAKKREVWEDMKLLMKEYS